MFSNKRFSVPVTLVLSNLLGVFAAMAAPPQCYNLASLQGSYGVIGNYAGGIAMALGVEYFDGNGNMTRNAMINQPTAGSTTGARTLQVTTNTATYTVNCDGTGQLNRVITNLTTGAVSNAVNDFVITGAVAKGGQLIATAIMDAQETPSAFVPGGIFVTFVHTQLPDRVGPPQM